MSVGPNTYTRARKCSSKCCVIFDRFCFVLFCFVGVCVCMCLCVCVVVVVVVFVVVCWGKGGGMPFSDSFNQMFSWKK